MQCMLYQHPDGLPDTIRSGLNSKVDQLLKVGVVSGVVCDVIKYDVIRCIAVSWCEWRRLTTSLQVVSTLTPRPLNWL